MMVEDPELKEAVAKLRAMARERQTLKDFLKPRIQKLFDDENPSMDEYRRQITDWDLDADQSFDADPITLRVTLAYDSDGDWFEVPAAMLVVADEELQVLFDARRMAKKKKEEEAAQARQEKALAQERATYERLHAKYGQQ